MHYGERLHTVFSTMDAIEEHVLAADLVIGVGSDPRRRRAQAGDAHMVKRMKKGAVIVDMAIDQGGCLETSRPTTHDDPTFMVDGVVHYCVANMPGAVARTSTFALNNATLPFVLELANKGYPQALIDNIHLRRGLNIVRGTIALQAVAEAHGLRFESPEQLLAI